MISIIATYFSLGAFFFLSGLGVAASFNKDYKLALDEFCLAGINVPFFIWNLIYILPQLKGD
jgi:hypothetical protein